MGGNCIGRPHLLHPLGPVWTRPTGEEVLELERAPSARCDRWGGAALS